MATRMRRTLLCLLLALVAQAHARVPPSARRNLASAREACLPEQMSAEAYTVLMVADPGLFSGTPEAIHFEEALRSPVSVPSGALLCPRVTVGTLMGHPTIVATSGIGPTTAALCAIDMAKCLGPRLKELIYVGTSGWSAAVGGILNAGHCEKANPTHKITRLGDVCVTPMSMNWNCKLADWVEQARGYPDLCFLPGETNGPQDAQLFGDCVFDTHTQGSLALADEILAASRTSSSTKAPLRNALLQGFEKEYWGYINNSTNRTYNLNSEKPPVVYDYMQCVEVDSQFFYSGVPWEMTARNYTALTINTAFNTSLTPLDVIAVSAMEAVGVAQAIDSYNALTSTTSPIPYVFVRGNSDWLHQPVMQLDDGTWTYTPKVPINFAEGYTYAIATTSNVVFGFLSERCKKLTSATNALSLKMTMNGLKTLDEIYGHDLDNCMENGLETISKIHQNVDNNLRTIDEIYGSNMGDMIEFTTTDGPVKKPTISCDIINFDVLSNLTISSPGIEVTSCIKNDGGCIPIRSLGTLKIPAIITGIWLAGRYGNIDMKKAINEMKLYAFAGLGAFEMADTNGPAEELYGVFCQEYWGHKPVLGLTKFVPRYGNSGADTRQVVEGTIDQSRQRMGVETLDLVQFHWWDYSDDRFCDSMKWLHILQQEGKIKELGLTNFDTDHMAKIVEDYGIQIVSNQVRYSIIDSRPEKKMVAWCLQHNVKLIAYGTLLGGFLSDKYLGQPEPERKDLTTTSLLKYKLIIDQWGCWALFQELLLALSNIANKHKVNISNVAIRYIADKPGVAAVIIGARLGISEHIACNQAAFSFPGLDEGDVALIQAVVKKGNELPGDCGDEYR